MTRARFPKEMQIEWDVHRSHGMDLCGYCHRPIHMHPCCQDCGGPAEEYVYDPKGDRHALCVVCARARGAEGWTTEAPPE
jgi:hypothetical protein